MLKLKPVSAKWRRLNRFTPTPVELWLAGVGRFNLRVVLFLFVSAQAQDPVLCSPMTLSWSKLSSISYFSGGSRLQFSLPSSTQRHQRPLRHSPSIPPQVQLQASASDVCKPGVRGAPQLTRVLDLEFCQLSRLCSPHVSSITTVAGLPTPLTAPLSSSQPYQLNIAASLLRRDSSQFIGFFGRRRLSHFVHEMGYFHFTVSLTSPIKLRGSHFFLAVSQPTLMWG
ncbi:hypothetical protein F2Q68_00037463 [Brassica cretica]|uniref:Uncharacterized protein n=1 Tax=Brassica cretica TaxID=69181 RepID=A0A8S9H6A5_BRACR|nr:hypothetical protein F2Q68_00037463 [Brassica cretica]